MDTSKENQFIERAHQKYLGGPLGIAKNALDYAKGSAELLLYLRDKGHY